MILTDLVVSKPEIIKESSTKDGPLPMVIAMPMLECEKEGRNRRIYPLSEVRKAIDEIMEKVNNRQLIGELDHPTSNDEERASLIFIKEASHLITDIKINGNIVKGKFELIENDNGQRVKQFIRQNILIGNSLRQAGELQTINNGQFYATNLSIITWDIVSNPSYNITYFTKKNIIESIQHIINNRKYNISNPEIWNKYNDRLIDLVVFNLTEQLKINRNAKNLKILNEVVRKEIKNILG